MTARPDHPPISRAVITIAVGKPVYLEYASNLARSFRHWHPQGDIEFHLVTDQQGEFDADLAFVRLHRTEPGSIGRSFTSKLHMDRFLVCDETLFIDADCLCVGHLGPVFEKFAGRTFSLVGRKMTSGEHFGDIEERCRKVGVPWTVKFVGSVYFLRRGDRCTEILAFARGLEARYEELGLTRLRGSYNEEPLLGLAMGNFGEEPVAEDGTVKADLMFYGARPKVDVYRGLADLRNRPGSPKPYPEWQMPDAVMPRIVHFNANWAESPPYTSEATRMRLVAALHLPRWLATAYTTAVMSWPHLLWSVAKDAFRPVYRRFFGYRKVKTSDRI